MPEKALPESVLHHLLEQMRTAVLCITNELHIIYANSAAETLFYMSQVRLINTSVTTFFAEQTKIEDIEKNTGDNVEQTDSVSADAFTALVKRAIEQHQGFTLRNVELRPHYLRQHPHHVDIMVTPLSIPKTLLSSTLVEKPLLDETSYLLLELNLRDRQTRIAREAQLNQQHAITRQMIRGVAHEIKNPLAGIRGAAQLLRRSLLQHMTDHQSDEFSEYTDVIINESDRLKELANNMLGSHKLLNLQPTNIHEPLEHVGKLIASQFDTIHINRDYDSSLPEIIIDADKLIQVFLNISLNAAQALTEHKTQDAALTFKTRIANNMTTNGKMHRKLIVISLIDNGPGIPHKIQKTLFYPMVSGRAQGTGLGLSIAHDIVQQHDGMLRYTSETGKTVFQVILPFTPSTTQQTRLTQTTLTQNQYQRSNP